MDAPKHCIVQKDRGQGPCLFKQLLREARAHLLRTAIRISVSRTVQTPVHFGSQQALRRMIVRVPHTPNPDSE